QAGLFVCSDELLLVRRFVQANWSSPKNSDTNLDLHNACVKIGYLQIEQLATDSAAQINNNDCQDVRIVLTLSGEIYLKTNTNQRLLRHNLQSEDNKPLGMKVDGIFHTPGNKKFEIGMVELSGGYLTSDMSQYIKDHVKGCWGGLDNFFKLLKEFKKSHRHNTALYSQSSILRDYVGNVNENLLLNPTGKRARTINPYSLTSNDHSDSNDSNENYSPSPSPSGYSDTLAH
ncbi:4893_t:CDS:2, partial [Dentiscutata erythropus]